MPSPVEMLPRGQPEPVPTQMTFESDGATLMSPIEPTLKYPSEIFAQVRPASVVFHTPPPV